MISDCPEHGLPLLPPIFMQCEECRAESIRRLERLKSGEPEVSARKESACPQCGGYVNPIEHVCTICGLEVVDIKDRRIVPISGHTSSAMDSKLVVGKQKEFGWKGFVCLFCVEWFKKEEERFPGEDFGFTWNKQNSPLGSDLTHFRTRAELNDHLKIVHGGKRPSYRGNSDHRLKPRKKHLNKGNSGGNLSRETQRDIDARTVEDSAPQNTDTTSTSTAQNATNSSLPSATAKRKSRGKRNE